jgi:hypothetical protein
MFKISAAAYEKWLPRIVCFCTSYLTLRFSTPPGTALWSGGALPVHS